MQINFKWVSFTDSLNIIKSFITYPVKQLFSFKFETLNLTGFDWFTRKITVVNPKTFFSDFFLNRQIDRILKKLEGDETAENLLTIDESIFVLRSIRKNSPSPNQKKFVDRLIELKLVPNHEEDLFSNYDLKSNISGFIAHLIRLKSDPQKKLSAFSASLPSFSPRILSPRLPGELIVIPASRMTEDPLEDFETWAELLNTNLTAQSKKLNELPISFPFQIGNQIYYKSNLNENLSDKLTLGSFIAGEGGLEKLAEKLERNELDLCSSGCLISLHFYFHDKIANVDPLALTSNEAKALYFILEKIKEMEIIPAQSYNPNELMSVNSFFNATFNGKSLSDWNALLDEISIFRLDLLKQIQKFPEITNEGQNLVLAKIQKMLNLGQKLSQIPNKEKLSVKEYYIYRCLMRVSALDINSELFTNPLKDHKNLLASFAELEKRGTKPFVRVCIKRFSRGKEEGLPEFKDKLEQFGIHLSKDQGHTNFIINQTFKTRLAGIGQLGYYNFKRTLSKTPKFEEFKIKVKALFHQNTQIDVKRAKEIFFQKLRDITSTSPNGGYPRLDKLLSAFFLPYQFKKTNPQELSFNGRHRHILCSQYVCEAIIMAHIQTCRDLGIEPPNSLSHYGLSDRQRMGSLVPHRFSRAFINQGILKPIKAVAWQI